ncbi:rRNA biogenesis protein rrp36 [Gaertneriomyces sp. JEL0708]|nr:rRNA biogenesis protein rrp36 [Gaertneriomyces sp. JEL0708]
MAPVSKGQVGRKPSAASRKPFPKRVEPLHESSASDYDDEDMEEMDEATIRAMRRMQSFDQDMEGQESDTSAQNASGDEHSSDAGVDDSEADSEDYENLESSADESDSDHLGEDSEQDDDADGNEETDADTKLAAIKAQLSEIPFDQLLEIQQKLGLKEFHTNYRKNQKEALKEDDSEDGNKAIKHTKFKKTADDFGKGKGKADKKDVAVKLAKRKDKNAPMELTSKRAVTRRRQVVELPKKKTRDPRFDPMAGKLNEGLFNQSYGFLKDYQKDEIEMLKKQIVSEKGETEKEKLQKTLKSMQSRIQERERQDKRKEIVKKWRKNEKELVAQGKKPWQLKKSDVKKLELVERYESMKKKDLNKFLEKRRQKNAAKEKRFMPYARRSADK